jgi:hypothetical protein
MHPLCQYDAIADPIMDWDTKPSNNEEFTAIMPPKALISEINPSATSFASGDPRRQMALRSESMDFSHEDAAPALELDQIVWKTVKGPDAVMPNPRGLHGEDDDD